MAGHVENRFTETSSDEISKLIKKSKSENTTKVTEKWMRVYYDWATLRERPHNIHQLPPVELDEILQHFFAEVKTRTGKDYEPNSLNSLHTGIDRYLRDNGYNFSIVRDREFLSSKSVLEGKAKMIRDNGGGQRPNRAHSLTEDEERVLWQCGQLGTKSPRALLNTIWWNLVQHFGLRGRENHHSMKIENFAIRVGDNKKEYVTFAEGITKTFQSGLREKYRLQKPKMVEKKMSTRCPVTIFKLYISKRPLTLRESGPLYLAPIDNPITDIWYKKAPMGMNTINNLMKTMIQNSPLASTINKKITNHSARKTVVKKLKKANVPKCDIIAITGHTTEAGLDAYDSGNEDHQEMLSHNIDLDDSIEVLEEPSASSNVLVPPLSYERTSAPIAGVVTPNDPRICNPNFNLFPHTNPFVPFYQPAPMPSYHPAYFPQQHQQQQQNLQPVYNHFTITNCTDLKIIGHPHAQQDRRQQEPPKKKRLRVIYDSSSDEE